VSSPSIKVRVLRDLASQEHQDKVAAVLALHRVGIEELPEPLAEYFGTRYSADVDFAKPGELGCLRFDDHDVRHGSKKPDEFFAFLPAEEMSVGVRISLERLPEGAHFIDVHLLY
jgi:hypothetical protein